MLNAVSFFRSMSNHTPTQIHNAIAFCKIICINTLIARKPTVYGVLMLWQHGNTMENKHVNPVELAIDMFGGVRKLAKCVGRDPAAVSRWRKSGLVPTQIQRKLLAAAAARDIGSTAHDIVFGRETHA